MDIPFVSAYKHIRDKVYPSYYQKIVKNLCWIIIVFITILNFILQLWGHEIINWVFLNALIVVCVYCFLFYLMSKRYGITLLGYVNNTQYAEYIFQNYWKHMEYESRTSFLKEVLCELKNQKGNDFEKNIKLLLNNTKNDFQKKYLIEIILSVCDTQDEERVIINILIPSIKEANNELKLFIIMSLEDWYSKNSNKQKLKAYCRLLNTIPKDSELVSLVLFDFAYYIVSNSNVAKDISIQEITGKIQIDSDTNITRLNAYIEAISDGFKTVQNALRKEHKSIDVSAIKNNSLEDIPQ
ncbi:MAG: hypothetical protein ACLSWJ_02090 [Alphaproteobacteria bacterium]